MSSQQRQLFVLPGLEPDLTFGVLRRRFEDRDNDTVDFVRGELHPIAPPTAVGVDGRNWSPTAERHELLLPNGVPDGFDDAQMLAEMFERQTVVGQSDLALVLKVTLSATRPLHEGWEAVRSFAREVLVDVHGLAAIVVLHAPFRSGTRAANAPHVHVIALARQLTPAGFAAFCTIANDRAHAPLAAEWATYRPA